MPSRVSTSSVPTRQTAFDYDRTVIQLCVREPTNILAVWPVRKDGRYGEDGEA